MMEYKQIVKEIRQSGSIAELQLSVKKLCAKIDSEMPNIKEVNKKYGY